MTYDLLFQAQEPGGAVDLAAIEAALRARGGISLSAGDWQWDFTHGRVMARALVESGPTTAFEVRVPFHDTTLLLEEAVSGALDVARELGLRLVDPQASHEIRGADGAWLTESYLRCARYAGDYVGVSSAVGAGSLGPAQEQAHLSLRLLLALIVFGLILMVTFRAMSR